MSYDRIRIFALGKSPKTNCLTVSTGVIVKSRYYKNILCCFGIVAILAILILTTSAASLLTTTFGMVLAVIPILLCLTTQKYFIFRKKGSRLDIVKLIGVYRKSEEYSYDDIESVHVETYKKPHYTLKKVSLRMKNDTVISLDETADADYVELLVNSICQASGIARS